MSEMNTARNESEMPLARDHLVGFVNSAAECKALVHALDEEGIPISNILVLHGREGIEIWDRLVERSVWDVRAAELVRAGNAELEAGRFAISVEIRDATDAATVAEVSAQHGGYRFHHYASGNHEIPTLSG